MPKSSVALLQFSYKRAQSKVSQEPSVTLGLSTSLQLNFTRGLKSEKVSFLLREQTLVSEGGDYNSYLGF